MAKVSIKTLDQTEQVDPPSGVDGEVETRSYFDGERHPLHLRLHRIAPGARLRLSGDESDVALYVWEGAVEAGGARLAPRSSAVIERGASLALTGCREGAALLAFNVREHGPEERAGGHVHLLPSERVPRTTSMGGNEGIGGALHADAHCATCKVWLHENDYAMADKETALHSHSEDEVIFVRAGGIRLGNRLYGPGTALAIAANVKYRFFSGPDGLSFVNFRGSSPTYTSADGSQVLDEAELWRSLLGKPEYLVPAEAG